MNGALHKGTFPFRFCFDTDCIFLSNRPSRIAVRDGNIRAKLVKLSASMNNNNNSKNTLAVGELKGLIACTKNSQSHGFLHHVLKWCWERYGLEGKSKPTLVFLSSGVRSFIKCLASESPVCSYLPPSAVELAFEIIEENVKDNMVKLRKIQTQLPIFYQLLKDVNGSRLPEEFKGCVLHLINQAVTPFKENHFVGNVKPTSEGSDLAL